MTLDTTTVSVPVSLISSTEDPILEDVGETTQLISHRDDDAEPHENGGLPLKSNNNSSKSMQSPKSFDYYVEGLLSRTIWALGEKIFPTIGKTQSRLLCLIHPTLKLLVHSLYINFH